MLRTATLPAHSVRFTTRERQMSDHPDSEEKKSVKVDVFSQAVGWGLDLAKSFRIYGVRLS